MNTKEKFRKTISKEHFHGTLLYGILRHALGVICSRIENATTMAGRCILGSRMTESAAERLEVLMGCGLVQINLTLLTASPRLT